MQRYRSIILAPMMGMAQGHLVAKALHPSCDY
jgi:hypothetical protein